MTIYSFVSATIESGGWTGVSRFDAELRRAIPGLVSVTRLPDLDSGDIVVTDNHLSLKVPERIRTVVVHHGCAKTHYDRDPEWRASGNKAMVDDQGRMFAMPNRTWVAPSAWVADEFRRIAKDERKTSLIPHWVEPIERRQVGARPVIIGDWRNFNKGSSVIPSLAAACPQWDFRPLDFRTAKERDLQYGEASLYLCLSLSEGGPYSVCDAEAAGLPIVTTDVGNYREFTDSRVIPWRARDDVRKVSGAIAGKLAAGRTKPSFYAGFGFEDWRERWLEVVA